MRNSFKITEFKRRLAENGKDDIISTTSKAASSFRVSGRGLRRERLLRVLNARSEVLLPFLPKQKMARRRRKAATAEEGRKEGRRGFAFKTKTHCVRVSRLTKGRKKGRGRPTFSEHKTGGEKEEEKKRSEVGIA